VGTGTRVLQYLDSAAVGHDEFARDGETQSAAAQAPLVCVPAMIEPVEYSLAILIRNARARVSDVEHDLAPLLP
jgi:hypothetical protein